MPKNEVALKQAAILDDFFTRLHTKINGLLVSKETVVLRRWGRSKQKFGFIKPVDKC